jgi:hypothetical protein
LMKLKTNQCHKNTDLARQQVSSLTNLQHLLWLCLAFLMTIEPIIGVRQNSVLLVFGQTTMFFYLVHRLALEVPATYFGLRGTGSLATTYVVSAVLVVSLYPACLWYRGLKRHCRIPF